MTDRAKGWVIAITFSLLVWAGIIALIRWLV
jgi:hypothetical protein